MYRESYPIHVPADAMDEFSAFAGYTWNDGRLEPIIAEALLAFIHGAKPARQEAAAGATGDEGYQWKQLFLPEGTRLRSSFDGEAYYAMVAGGQITRGEQTMTPSGFANLRGSGNRNAWQAIWLRFPGKEQWLRAEACRAGQKDALARLF